MLVRQRQSLSTSINESSCMTAGGKYENNVGSASVSVYVVSLAMQHVLPNLWNWWNWWARISDSLLCAFWIYVVFVWNNIWTWLMFSMYVPVLKSILLFRSFACSVSPCLFAMPWQWFCTWVPPCILWNHDEDYQYGNQYHYHHHDQRHGYGSGWNWNHWNYHDNEGSGGNQHPKQSDAARKDAKTPPKVQNPKAKPSPDSKTTKKGAKDVKKTVTKNGSAGKSSNRPWRSGRIYCGP